MTESNSLPYPAEGKNYHSASLIFIWNEKVKITQNVGTLNGCSLSKI